MLNKYIQNYKIIRKIDEGGMATVYEAVHIKLNTKVAIKILDPIRARNNNVKQRFGNEARIMANLTHKNITRAIDFIEQDDTVAIIMEFLDGYNLSNYIKKYGALGRNNVIPFFHQILDAFAYAHQNGIVHRDVKPSNIFIENNGIIKILDFGIAKVIEGNINLTATGSQMGTLMYMSPEQIIDSKEIGISSDIYSLGVVLYYMLNGKPPYNTQTTDRLEIQNQIVKKPFPNLKDNPEINEIIQKATAKATDNRHKTCEEFMYELQSIAQKIDITQINLKAKKNNTKKNQENEIPQIDEVTQKQENKTVIIPTVTKKNNSKKKQKNEIPQIDQKTQKQENKTVVIPTDTKKNNTKKKKKNKIKKNIIY